MNDETMARLSMAWLSEELQVPCTSEAEGVGPTIAEKRELLDRKFAAAVQRFMEMLDPVNTALLLTHMIVENAGGEIVIPQAVVSEELNEVGKAQAGMPVVKVTYQVLRDGSIRLFFAPES